MTPPRASKSPASKARLASSHPCQKTFAQVATDFATANAKLLNANADFAIEPVANFAALNRR